MESIKKFDKLNLQDDNDIKKLIGDEPIYFSNHIKKLNHYHMRQDRVLILTDKALYNTKNKLLKRKLPYEEITGITYTTFNYNFIIHGQESKHDIIFISPERHIIICLISLFYEKITEKEMKIYETTDKSSLKTLTNSKKDKKNDSSKIEEKFLTNTQKFLETYDGEIFGTPSINSRSRSGTIFSSHSTIKTVNLEDFEILTLIGRGSYGKVYLVKYKITNEYYAMKSLQKDFLIDQDQIECTLLEKKILQNLDYPFLVGMVFCFQTEERIYFIMPFVQGGELFQHLKNEKYFKEEKVKFYASIIGLSLEYLHNNEIIYRDIKPENILIDADGYLKLIDFGLAKILENDEKATSFCGTPEYLAPEIIEGKGHGKSADWWSYGILIYELLFGISPFYFENIDKMYTFIVRADVRFPKKVKVSDDAKDLIKMLLIKDPNLRLGAKGGFEKIKEHPFFKGVDFDALLQKKIKAPYKPKLKDITDVRNFSKFFTCQDISMSDIPESKLKLIQENQDLFEDFDH